MQSYNTVDSTNQSIDFRDFFISLFRQKNRILFCTILFAIVCVVIALRLPNIYQTEVILVPTNEKVGGKFASQLSGLASLAGLNVGGQGLDKTAIALELLGSRKFLTNFIVQNDLFVPIMAAKRWDLESQKLIIDDSIYDEATKKWVRDVSPPLLPKPTPLETYDEFVKALSVSQDKSTNIITLGLAHKSPVLAKEWLETLVHNVNDEMRERDIQEATRSISFIEKKISDTSNAELKKLLYSIIEEQTKTLMLANVNKEYVFKTIDPPYVPEKKLKPNRALIVIAGTISGFLIFSVFFVFLDRRNTKQKIGFSAV